MQTSSGLSASSLQPEVAVGGVMTLRENDDDATMTLAVNGQSQTQTASGTYANRGYYMEDNGGIDLIVERGETLTFSYLGPLNATDWGCRRRVNRRGRRAQSRSLRGRAPRRPARSARLPLRAAQ